MRHRCGQWNDPSLFELQFEGLIIEQGWLISVPCAALMVFGLVFCFAIMSRFVFGGWDAAWGAAGCMVAVVTLMYVATE